jgi:hypothetical protein
MRVRAVTPTVARNWAFAVGLSMCACGALYYAWRERRVRRTVAPSAPDPVALRDAAVAALRADPTLSGRDVRVVAMAPGIFDVSGVVGSPADAVRVLDIVRRTTQARTVLNRLTVSDRVVVAAGTGVQPAGAAGPG